MRGFVYIFTIFLIIVNTLSGCRQNQSESVPAELMAAIDSFYAAIEAGDIETRIGLLDIDALMLPNHWPMSQGREHIAAGIQSETEWEFRLRDRQVIEIDISGSLAYTVNSYYYTYHAVGTEPQWHKTKNVHIWKRNADGNWKLKVDIWNSDVGMQAFSNE
ncbi:MAG: DUF4440 domain-containing protein [candidate division Zixibacteria bacterium]|nr:DUF4440 domain-containing protein [candidate division Zixibacteria bacterium]